MLSFNLTEEQEMIRQMARNFAKKEILPVAEHYDQSDEFPWPIIRKAQKTGLISSNVPEAYSGPGLGVLEECIINEELAWACSGVQTVIMLNNLAAWPIILAGSADQKERFSTTADRWRATGGLRPHRARGRLRCGGHPEHGGAPG